MRKDSKFKRTGADYLGDRQSSERLADYIRTYWRKAGFLGIRVWVEKDERARYVIRSNLAWSVPK